MYTTPLATTGLAQCDPPMPLSLHRRLPLVGSSASMMLGPAAYTTLLATSGELRCPLCCHLAVSDGLPLPSAVTVSAERPLSLPTKTQTVPALSVHDAGAVSTSLPCGTFTICSSPPVWPGAPLPLKLPRSTRRSLAS